jgi:hypothetical protein
MRNSIAALFFLFILVFCAVQPMVAQSDSSVLKKKNKLKLSAVRINYQNGHIFGTNEFLRGSNAVLDTLNDFQSISLEYVRQTNGNKLWEQLYGYPEWGGGLSVFDFFNAIEIGTPIVIYGFFNAPFKRWNRLSFNYKLGFGVSFNWKPFDPITNKYNVSIGSGRAFYIDAGVNINYRIVKRFEIGGGIALTHFSNGALKKPNKGINTIAPEIRIKYNFYDKVEYKEQNVPEYLNENEFAFSIFAGAKNLVFDSIDVDLIEKYEGVNYYIFGISGLYNKQISYKSKFGIGLSVSYNGSLDAKVSIENNELEAEDSPFMEKLQMSIYPSYELVIHKLSVSLQPAFYLYRKTIDDQTPVFHQRLGVKYHFTNQFYASVVLRAYSFYISDFVEWHVGYRIKWQ